MPPVQLLCGDSRETLKTLPKGCVQTVITSPPYFNLRDYQVEGQIGLEATPEAFCAALVEVFREVRRVLRDDGTLWVNLGDSYAGGKTGRDDYGSASSNLNNAIVGNGKTGVRHSTPTRQRKPPAGIKPKDLLGIPWMMAFALRADGWYLRQEVTWLKTSAMPESVDDRPTSATEKVFLFSKKPRYFYDRFAVLQPDKGTDHPRHVLNRPEPSGGVMPPHNGIRKAEGRNGQGANLRNYWLLGPEPFTAKKYGITETDHYAAFPSELARRCLLLSTSEAGCCSECGAPWRRVVEKSASGDGTGNGCKAPRRTYPTNGRCGEASSLTLGWSPSCTCEAGEPVPCTILDPFAGTGTVGEVALKHNRHAILGELNPAYQRIIRARCIRSENLFSGRAFVDVA